MWNAIDGVIFDDVPWLFVGDFNIIRAKGERVEVIRDLWRLWTILTIVWKRCGLLDFPSNGHKISWCNSQEGHNRSWAKMDKVVVNAKFLSAFPHFCVE